VYADKPVGINVPLDPNTPAYANKTRGAHAPIDVIGQSFPERLLQRFRDAPDGQKLGVRRLAMM